MTHPYLELLTVNCAKCGHNKLSHQIVKGVRRACCFGTAKLICQCRKFEDPSSTGEVTGAGEASSHRANRPPSGSR